MNSVKIHIVKFTFLLSFLIIENSGYAQTKKDSIEPYAIRKDAIDIYNYVFNRKNAVRSDTVRKTPGKFYPSFFITPGYAVQSGVSINFSNATAIYLSKDANISSLLTYISFTQKKQILIPVETNIFTSGNEWNFQGNWYYLKYPVSTFGLGNNTPDNNEIVLDFNTLRINELAMKKTGDFSYVGFGYNLSKYWKINQTEKNGNTYYDEYGFSPDPVSSGIEFAFQFDSRENSLNPNRASYVNASFVQNLHELGSNTDWSSLLIDARHYINFPRRTNNVLAFWSYNWITPGGIPPYLDLPSNGWDTYSNTTRGYMEGRHRGLCMIDLETEYRIHFMKNDLFGAVVFGHIESYSDLANRFYFNKVLPGGGIGLRIKVNKFSNTNLSVDYGFGINGSHGLFFNLGEVF
ncbi:MAG: hypothetical protein ACXVPN_08215 [Bacteroidia bacterium]